MSSVSQWTPPRPRRVLIIGGGPVGLVTLRNFLHRAMFDVVQLVERRAEVGGVWYIDGDDTNPNHGHKCSRWPSPAYPGLMGNVLPRFMSFSGHPFPAPPSAPDQPFPDLVQTQTYLLKFAEPLRAHIKLNTEVVAVDEDENGGWKVVMKDWSADGTQGKEVIEHWDAVAIATAWYDNPKWPDTEGLEELKKAGIARHAKDWMGVERELAEEFMGKRTAVIGNANSANDIASQLAEALSSSPSSKGTSNPVYHSIRRPTMHYFPILPHPNLRNVAPVERYEVTYHEENNDGNDKKKSEAKAKATLHLTDGTLIPDVDHVFFGTGYACHVPFVRVLSPPSPPSIQRTLAPLCSTTTTTKDPTLPPIPSLHRHILYAPNPTLAFLGGIVSATPFILGDLASTWVALFWSPPSLSRHLPSTPPQSDSPNSNSNTDLPTNNPHPQSIPFPPTLPERLTSSQTRTAQIAALRESMGDTPTSLLAYHILGPEELVYARELWGDVGRVRPDLVEPSRNGDGDGDRKGDRKGDGLMEWSDEMWAEKEGMFGLKETVLKRVQRGAREEGSKDL